MIPEVARFALIPVNSFGLMVALAMCAAWLRIERDFQKNGLPPRLAERYVLVGTLCGLAGARLWHVGHQLMWREAERFNLTLILENIISVRSGFVFYGGFLLATFIVVLMARFDRIRAHLIADSIGPGMALCYLVGRLGCQLSGDGDYGLPTESFFGMSYAYGAFPTAPGVRVFPTPFVESALSACALAFLISAQDSRAWAKPWRRFGLYLTLMSLERFVVEYLRAEPRYNIGAGITGDANSLLVLSEAQIFALLGFSVGACLSFRPSNESKTTESKREESAKDQAVTKSV